MRPLLTALLSLLLAGQALAAIEINQATEADLDGLRGLGPVKARELSAQGLRVNGEAFSTRQTEVGGQASP